METTEPNPRWSPKQKVLLGLLAMLLLIVLWLFVQSLRYAIHTIHHRSELYRAQQLRSAHALAPEDVQTWMTFDYVNRVFGLPKEYLQQNLAIEEKGYPSIQIGRYAKQQHLDKEQLLSSIRNLISKWRQQH
jgi:hypothetical protein